MKILKGAAFVFMAAVSLVSFAGCVDQHQENLSAENVESRVVATSYSTVVICDKLDIDLIAVPKTSIGLPERYEGLPEIGSAMSPDAEALAVLEPTDVIGPDTLKETIEPMYQAAGVPYTFIDLQSVQGMYDSIKLLGKKYGSEKQADELIVEYEKIMEDFKASVDGMKKPKVLVLMGLPGSYIECTSNSYTGSLIELAGAENAVQVETEENFVSWNTEDLLKLDPDVILLTAHGLPEDAMKMFAEEFSTNDIWKHFRAVQENRVYQLDHNIFGMSCTFDWPEALDTLKKILYDETYEAYDAEAAYEAE